MAFKTYDAVKANEAVDANEAVATDIEDVWLVKITLEPFTANEPDIETLPVKLWVFETIVPNLVDPVTKSTDDVIVCTTSVWAVIVSVTVKLPVILTEPVIFWLPIKEFELVVAKVLFIAFWDDVYDKKLLDNVLIDPLNEAVAVFSCASVANAASRDELNASKLLIRVLVEPV